MEIASDEMVGARDEIAKPIGWLGIGANAGSVVAVPPLEYSNAVDRAPAVDVRRGAVPNQNDARLHGGFRYRPDRAESSARIPAGNRVPQVSGECSPFGTSKYRTE